MKSTFQKRLRNLILLLMLGFVALFLFRLAYGYQVVAAGAVQNLVENSNFISTESTRNYASIKYKAKSGAGQAAVQVDQKYEKVADVNTKSSKFEEEEKLARELIEKYDALIQYEQKSGNPGKRRLKFLIGVPPDNFDALYNELVNIGNIQSKQITKTDKTNEYKELNAKKASLEKIRTSLIELKSKGGKIEEYMDLENRILEIEQQLQNLGVSLGDFDAENEFCTVKFALNEGKEVSISFLHRVKVALEWTIWNYLGIVGILVFVSLLAYLMLLIIEKFKLFGRLMNP